MAQSRLLRNIHLGIKSLMLHKLRSFLTILGVVFGVGSVVSMLSVGEGASRDALSYIKRLGASTLLIESVKPIEEMDASSAASQRWHSAFGLRYADEPRLSALPHVVRTVPAKLLNNREARVGERTANVRIVGTTPEWFELIRRPLIAGRVLDGKDMREGDGVCVLSEQAARDLLPGTAAIGQDITIGSKYHFRVVGVIQADKGSAGGVQTPDQPYDMYIPLNVVRQRYHDTDRQKNAGTYSREEVELHRIIVEVDDVRYVKPTAVAAREMLGRFHSRLDYEIKVPLALIRQAQATQRVFGIVLASIASISLLVGGIGIMNIMLASVTERTREIGVRRAIGAKRRQIIGQFLIETVVLSLVGGVIGVALGVMVPSFITAFTQMSTVVTVWSVLLSLGISVLVGVIFGLYPAYRAAAVDPIVALRHE
ncbi:MAG: ABC transporter permease [Phycisphaeraceae bacterium]|nr:ABC transporter permease [Phycisphaeraceae bacterium]